MSNGNKYKQICILFLLVSVISSIYSGALSWDPAGTGNFSGNLHGLDIRIQDEYFNKGHYKKKYDHYKLDGFLGRFIYQGEEGVVLTFNSESPHDFNSFNYRYINNPDIYRKVFFVTTVKGKRHNGTKTGPLYSHNVIIDSPGDTFTIPAGAGPELLDSPSTPSNQGYNDTGQLGSGLDYTYVYPYEYLWIDITAVRTNDSDLGVFNFGEYRCPLMITGIDICSQLHLTGYKDVLGFGAVDGKSYLFSAERTCPSIIPFDILKTHSGLDNTYTVGSLMYQSEINPAIISFHSDREGNSVDFKFVNEYNQTFDYEVVFKPNTPNNGRTWIYNENNNSFGTTTYNYISPIYGELINQHYLQGDISIFLNPSSNPLLYATGTYSSTIYLLVDVQ